MMLFFHCHTHFFFFNDTATTEIYTLSLHDALPIYPLQRHAIVFQSVPYERKILARVDVSGAGMAGLNDVCGHDIVTSIGRSEEHTSELQSRLHLVCRLLLEKKKKK